MTLAQGTSSRCSLMLLVYHCRRSNPRSHDEELGSIAERFVERLLGAVPCCCNSRHCPTPPLVAKGSRMIDQCPRDALSSLGDKDIDCEQPGRIEGEHGEPREAVGTFGHERRDARICDQ